MSPIEALRHEYEAEDGTFLLRARTERVWDHDAFNRLQRTMREVCEELAGQDRIERWMADAFWYAEGFVRDDPSFHRPEPHEYFEDAKRRMLDLCSWLFTSQSPYMPDHDWPDL